MITAADHLLLSQAHLLQQFSCEGVLGDLGRGEVGQVDALGPIEKRLPQVCVEVIAHTS